MSSMRMHVDIDGMDGLFRVLATSGRRAVGATGRYLYQVASEVFNDSQEQVPVDTGALRSSGAVDGPSVTGSQVSVTIGYGNAAIQYALEQHENLEYYHLPPTKAKYLEDPLVARLDDIRRGLSLTLEKEFGA